jgi:phosphoglycerate kinase
MDSLPTLATLEADRPSLSGVRALVRFDFNVPIASGAIVDDFRIVQSLPTLRWLLERGAKVRIIAHLKSPETDSLAIVAQSLRDKGFATRLVDSFDDAAAVAAADDAGEVVLFENLRRNDGEEANDPAFAARLAAHADIYINDAFSVSHRDHASVVGVPKLLPSYFGLQMQDEVECVGRAFSPKEPLMVVIGGAKFETKLPILDRFRGHAAAIYVVGALAHDVYVGRGLPVGKSATSGAVDVSAYAADPTVLVPDAVIVSDTAFTTPGTAKAITDVAADDVIVDAAPSAMDEMIARLSTAGTILWNGPIGFCEKGFAEATDRLALALAGMTDKGAMTILGGGDTLAAIKKLGTMERYTFVSTGGGAMLDFLAEGTLPGIEAVKASKRI